MDYLLNQILHNFFFHSVYQNTFDDMSKQNKWQLYNDVYNFCVNKWQIYGSARLPDREQHIYDACEQQIVQTLSANRIVRGRNSRKKYSNHHRSEDSIFHCENRTSSIPTGHINTMHTLSLTNKKNKYTHRNGLRRTATLTNAGNIVA